MTTPTPTELPPVIHVPAGLNGPRTSTNGGVAAGTIARLVAGPVTVRLHAPVPLDTDLAVTTDGDGVVASRPDGEPVMTARPSPPPDVVVPDVDPVSVGDGVPFPDHPAPTCVVCGHEHPAGLRMFPAPVAGHPGVLATWWTPPAWSIDDTGHLRDDLLWGVLDCPGALAVMHQEDEPAFAALGSITGEVVAPVRAGERVLVLGFTGGVDGRKRHCGTAVLGPDGDVRAHSSQVCIAVPPAWASDNS